MPLSQFDGKFIDGLEFCKLTYDLFEKIRNSQEGISRLRMRSSEIEKKLLEELLPIAKYIQAKYRAGRYISVNWINGNQQFDAQITQRGAYVEDTSIVENAFLEVTCVMHPNDFLQREVINKNGASFGLKGLRRLKSREIESIPTVYSGNEFILEFCQLIIKQITKKETINYPPETSLIVECTLNRKYMPSEWQDLLTEVRKNMPVHQFQEIFIYDAISHDFASL